MERAGSNRFLEADTPPPEDDHHEENEAAEHGIMDEADVPDSVFLDTEFNRRLSLSDEKDSDNVAWVRIQDVYPVHKEEGLLPSDLSHEDIAQGTHPDCFFISSIISIAKTDPELIRRVFVSKEFKQCGKYVFQFYRWNKWVKVVVDDTVAVSGTGSRAKLLHARSPTSRVWPLLLEKAYAKFYGSFASLEGGNLTECMHDLTSQPVVTIQTSWKESGVDSPAWWNKFMKQVNSGEVAATAGTKAAMPSQKVDPSFFRLQGKHAYAILGVFKADTSSAGDAKGIENFFVKLRNPSKNPSYHEVKGKKYAAVPKWSAEMLAKMKYSHEEQEDPSILYLPASVLQDNRVFATIHVCFAKSCEARTNFTGEWNTKPLDNAGGTSNHTSFRKNPIFHVMNRGKKDIEAVVMLKQPDQRSTLLERMQQGTKNVDYEDKDGNDRFNYFGTGVTVLRHTEEKHPIPTTLLTNHNHKIIHKPLFTTQRDVTNVVTFPADSSTYLVPSTFNPGENSQYLLQLYRTPDEKLLFRRLVPDVEASKPAVTLSKRIQGGGGPWVSYVKIAKPSELHVLVRQSLAAEAGKNETSAAVGAAHALRGGPAALGDVVAPNYVQFSVSSLSHQDIPICEVKAINYRELSCVTAGEVPAGTYNIAVQCVKQTSKEKKGEPKGFPVELQLFAAAEAHAEVQEEAPPQVPKPSAPSRPPLKQSTAGPKTPPPKASAGKKAPAAGIGAKKSAPVKSMVVKTKVVVGKSGGRPGERAAAAPKPATKRSSGRSGGGAPGNMMQRAQGGMSAMMIDYANLE